MLERGGEGIALRLAERLIAVRVQQRPAPVGHEPTDDHPEVQRQLPARQPARLEMVDVVLVQGMSAERRGEHAAEQERPGREDDAATQPPDAPWRGYAHKEQ